MSDLGDRLQDEIDAIDSLQTASEKSGSDEGDPWASEYEAFVHEVKRVFNEAAADPAVDVFAIGGQSNAEGRGDATLSPDVTSEAALYYDGASLVTLDDPVGGAQDGSAWPAFAKRYYELTGRQSVWVEAAKGASAQDAGAEKNDNGNWDDTGSLRGDLVTEVNNVLSHLDTEDYGATFRGIVWSQGERDAKAIDNGAITQADYQGALETMLDYFDGQFADPWTFCLFETGRESGGDTAGFRAVRESQRAVARDPAYAQVSYLSGEQRTFPERGLMQTDGLHYDQDGLNLMGRTGAQRLATGPIRPRRQPVSVYQTAPQTVPSGSWTTAAFDTVESDEFDQFDGSANQVVIEAPGRYAVSGQVLWDNSVPDGTGLGMRIRLNGGRGAGSIIVSGASDFVSSTVGARVMTLAAGDVLEPQFRQQSGAALDTFGTENWCNFSVVPIMEPR